MEQGLVLLDSHEDLRKKKETKYYYNSDEPNKKKKKTDMYEYWPAPSIPRLAEYHRLDRHRSFVNL